MGKYTHNSQPATITGKEFSELLFAATQIHPVGLDGGESVLGKSSLQNAECHAMAWGIASMLNDLNDDE